jgi:hypothetical protein
MRAHGSNALVWILAVAVAAGGLVGRAAAGSPPFPATVDEALAMGLERVVVRVAVAQPADVQAIASWVEPWEVDLAAGFLIVDVDILGYQRLLDLGFEVSLDAKKTEKYNRVVKALPDQVEGIPGYPCYRTVEETLAAGQALAAANPGLTEWLDIGDSWEKTAAGGLPGYDLRVLRLTNESIGGDKPDLWVEGAIHAREYTTAETATRFAEHLLASYGVDPDITWLIDHHEIHILLQTNPDGRKHAEAGESWRKNTNGTYCGTSSPYRGADLNRNFDFYWGCCGGSSSDPCDETFRGASAASEPETQAVQSYVLANFPDFRPDDLTTPAPPETTGVFIDLHSYGGDVLTAFGFQDPPNATQYLTLGRKLAYFNGYAARLGSLYPVDGSTKDWAYGRLGTAAFTIEMGTDFFEECAPFESTIYPDNLEMLIYAAKSARGPWRLAAGPEVVAPAPLPTVVAPGEPVTVNATANDTRYEAGSGEPTQPIAGAQLFVDIPPWSPGATPIAMVAVDGQFNSTVEQVRATVPTGALGNGRHTAYLQAVDTAGNWGVVSAAFFWVLDPAQAAHIAGEVRSASGGQPLAAAVTAGPFATATDPGDGSYDLMLPAGTYDVTATADGHAPFTSGNVPAVTGQTTPLDFYLAPYTQVLVDDVEGGNIGWTAQSPWAITTEASASPTHSWTDSPGGNYGNYLNVSLTSPVLNLTGMTGTTLEFAHIYDLESGWDYGHVELSTNGGASWSTVTSYSGVNHTTWETVTIEVPQLDGVATARFRFRLTSDSNTVEDGWHVDDIVVQAFVPPAADFTLDASPGTVQICAGDSAEYTIIVGAISGFANPVTLAASGQPAGSTAGFTPNPVTPPGSSLATVGNTGGAAPGSYDITINGTASGSSGHSVQVTLGVVAPAPPPALTAPPNGATGQPLRPVFQWTAAAGADAYTLEVDDDPGFGSPAILETGIVGTSYVPTTDLEGSATYSWRVRSENLCGAGAASTVFSFTTSSALPFEDGFEAGDTSAWSATMP